MPWGAPTSLGTGSGPGGTPTITIGPSVAVPAGAMIVVCVYDSGGSGSTIDNLNSINYSRVGSFSDTNSTYFLYTSAAGTPTITYSKFNAASSALASAFYITGGGAAYDSAVFNTASGFSNVPSVVSNVPSEANEFFVAQLIYSGVDAFTQDVGNGWAAPPDIIQVVTTLAGGSQVNAGGGALTFSPTLGAADNWFVHVIAFKPPAFAYFGEFIAPSDNLIGIRRQEIVGY